MVPRLSFGLTTPTHTRPVVRRASSETETPGLTDRLETTLNETAGKAPLSRTLRIRSMSTALMVHLISVTPNLMMNSPPAACAALGLMTIMQHTVLRPSPEKSAPEPMPLAAPRILFAEDD